jgi:hypothetical protein
MVSRETKPSGAAEFVNIGDMITRFGSSSLLILMGENKFGLSMSSIPFSKLA